MLIEFKVTNFRSIREEQTFSLVAAKTDKDLPACVIERELPGLSGVKFLNGAAIYGANASGKSNVLAAIKYVSDFVQQSATRIQPGDKTGAEPFKLDRASATKPSEFEVTFVADGVRFVFGFAVTPERVIEEYLVAYPKGAPQRWYHRKFNVKTKSYEWAIPSTAFKQDKSLQDKTRENSLFLSVGPQFNHTQLTQVFNWFKNKLHFIHPSAESGLRPDFAATYSPGTASTLALGAGSRLCPDFAATAWQITNPTHYDRIVNLLRSADFGVADARVQQLNIMVEDPESELEQGDDFRINLTHKAEGIEPVALDFDDEESAGTRRFFALIGPWMDILENGYTVFVDEIETSLHPVLVKELLKLVFSSKNNSKGAQVVFTTHNPVLLDSTLMRRDQVWFTEKSPNGATHLYPLTDYQPRKDEALARGYLAGRYGAIPFLPEGLKL